MKPQTSTVFFLAFLICVMTGGLCTASTGKNIISFYDKKPTERLTKNELIEDIRQLQDIIESSHPDPYTHGGGRIQFHRRLQLLMNSVPDKGMTTDEFIKLLRPFLAAIGDQHTSIYSEYAVDNSYPGGLPYVFGVSEQNLYIQIPFLETDEEYIGSLLLSVEGVSIPELVRRFKNLEGCENIYFALRQFARSNLLFEPYLSELLPEWKNHDSVSFTVRRPSGSLETITRKLPVKINPPLHFPDSVIDLPKTDDSGFLCEFLQPKKSEHEIAYLRVDHLQGFREAKERKVAGGTQDISEEELSATPSATESFRRFVKEMKKRHSLSLIIDMRKNGGGNYMMAPILIYFLYGKDVLTTINKAASLSGGGFGEQYSPLFFKTHTKVTWEDINKNRSIPLQMGDIDFSRVLGDLNSEKENPARLKDYQTCTSFYDEYQKETYSGFYCPPRVLVLMTPWTSSSGLDMALFLYRAGAELVGTPSAQAPNSWGELLEWQLDNSGIKGEVSHSFTIEFGDDPEKGRVLPVHHPLTYNKLKSYDFDINAEFLFALELLKESIDKVN
jgi:hypothetical protein